MNRESFSGKTRKGLNATIRIERWPADFFLHAEGPGIFGSFIVQQLPRKSGKWEFQGISRDDQERARIHPTRQNLGGALVAHALEEIASQRGRELRISDVVNHGFQKKLEEMGGQPSQGKLGLNFIWNEESITHPEKRKLWAKYLLRQ